MLKITNISIIFPIYNEERRIKISLNNISKFIAKHKFKKIEIILVDDGSNDQTENNIKFFLKKLMNNNIKYIKLNKNCGKGYALKKGVLTAKYDWVLTCDIDLSVDLKQIYNWNNFFFKKKIQKYFLVLEVLKVPLLRKVWLELFLEVFLIFF